MSYAQFVTQRRLRRIATDAEGLLFGYQGGYDPRQFGATFSRASTATFLDASGVVQTAASGVPRFSHYDPANPSLGPLLLLEGARTNLLTYCRDLSNVAWTASNVTVAATTGADGVAASGSRLTATAGNGTVIRAAALVHGSAAYSGSFFIKRITGTGNVDITLDNGATWTTVTVTAAYTQLGKTQTLANSQFGIRLVTSGDVVDVDFCQDEAGAFRSSAIATTSAAVTRAADALSFPFLAPPQAMTVYADWVDIGNVAGQYVVAISNAGASAPRFVIEKGVGAGYRTQYVQDAGGLNVALSPVATAPTTGQREEFLATLSASGLAMGYSSINSGAMETGGTPTAYALPAAWAGSVLSVSGYTGAAYSIALRSLKVAMLPQTLNYMRYLPTSF